MQRSRRTDRHPGIDEMIGRADLKASSNLSASPGMTSSTACSRIIC